MRGIDVSNLTNIVIGLIVVGLLLVHQLSGSESSIRQLSWFVDGSGSLFEIRLPKSAPTHS